MATDAHSKAWASWVALPNSALITAFVLLGHITVLVTYVLVNIELWSNWPVPYETAWFTVHFALMLFDKHVSHNNDLMTGRVHVSVTQRSILQGIMSFALTVDAFAFGRELNVVAWDRAASGSVTADDRAKLAVVTIVFFCTFVRCLELRLSEETERGVYDTPTVFSVATDTGGKLSRGRRSRSTTLTSNHPSRRSTAVFGGGSGDGVH